MDYNYIRPPLELQRFASSQAGIHRNLLFFERDRRRTAPPNRAETFCALCKKNDSVPGGLDKRNGKKAQIADGRKVCCIGGSKQDDLPPINGKWLSADPYAKAFGILPHYLLKKLYVRISYDIYCHLRAVMLAPNIT